ncbi:hypothetical protein [Chryseobacterium sp.]|uniref:hypothetical protein n=1 Tax=Chryseobacterium sp. TaxID=1871047 RepID=UPI002FCAF7AE
MHLEKLLYLPVQDHLGNARVSFAKNSAGALQAIDTNNYYPFGLNHIGESSYSSIGSYNNYKYNGRSFRRRECMTMGQGCIWLTWEDGVF